MVALSELSQDICTKVLQNVLMIIRFALNHPPVSPHPLLQTIVMQHCCEMLASLQGKDILFQTNSLSLYQM